MFFSVEFGHCDCQPSQGLLMQNNGLPCELEWSHTGSYRYLPFTVLECGGEIMPHMGLLMTMTPMLAEYEAENISVNQFETAVCRCFLG